jgi:hypothetical protein
MTDLIWSFAPWVAFLVVGRFASFTEAIAAGLLVAVVVLVRSIARHQVHMLDVVSPAYFVIVGALVVLIHPGHLDDWTRYAQAGAHATLTLLVFGSILVGHPFTESYARESVPQAYWDSPQFRAVNRRISTAWGLAFLIGTLSLIVAGSVDFRQALLRVVVPFGSLVMAYKYTQSQTEDADDGTPTGAIAGPAATR